MKNRVILLHYHIFKNAGSTLEWLLKKNFPDSFSTIHEGGEKGTLYAEEIVNYVVGQPRIQAISSHHIRYPRPERFGFRFIDICFLRHPLDRLQSMYWHYKKTSEPCDKSTKAKSLSLPDWLRWMVEFEPFNMINPQTCFLALGGSYFFPPSASQLAVARKIVEDMRFLGVVDRFDESLRVAQFFLRPLFPNFDMSYVPQNVSDAWRATLSDKLKAMEKECGTTFFNRMRELNELDEHVWRCATDELERRLRYVPDGENNR